MPNNIDPYQGGHLLQMIWFKTVGKDYQQMTRHHYEALSSQFNYIYSTSRE